MKKRGLKLCQLVLLAMLAGCTFVSANQARADILPLCFGFPCLSAEDCGNQCWCNIAMGMCYPASPR
jgi:hypothetical protein